MHNRKYLFSYKILYDMSTKNKKQKRITVLFKTKIDALKGAGGQRTIYIIRTISKH